MTTDADDALNWDGDDAAQPARPVLPEGWNAVGKNSEQVEIVSEDGEVIAEDDRPSLSTAMLLFVGIIGGIYLLYTAGWIIGGANLQSSAMFLIPSVMYEVARWAA